MGTETKKPNRLVSGLADIATQGAAGAINTGMGMILGKWNDKRQLEQQQKLQEMQMKGSKELMDYEMMKQLEMWQNTGYAAQKKQMKEADINPALMYGMGGGGAQTTGNTGAMVSGGEAPKGGREIQEMMGMGLQRGMQAAQIKLMESQAANLDADTKNKGTGGIIQQEAGSRMAKLAAETANLGIQKEILEVDKAIKEIQKRVAGETADTEIQQANVDLRTAIQNYRSAAVKANVAEETQDEQIRIMQEEAIGAKLKNLLTGAQTQLTEKGIQVSDAQINKMAADIAQGWQKIKIDAYNANSNRTTASAAWNQSESNIRNAATNEKNAATQAWKAAMDAGNPAIWNVLGGEALRAIEAIWNIFGSERPQYKTK